jgi:hypothetical protein
MAGALVVAAGVLSMGGCPRPDDGFEPNDMVETATPLAAGVPVVARSTQFNPDWFSIEAKAGQTVAFLAESLDFEVCPLFSAAGPDGTILYQEPLYSCRDFEPVPPDVQAEGVTLTIVPDVSFELRIPAYVDGLYYLSITEGAHADNVFTYSWEYRLIATLE